MDDFWNPIQHLIEQSCLEFDKIWQKRKRVIDSQFLVIFILKLVLSKNKQGYNSVLTELWESKEVGALQKEPVSASSICEARQKMPASVFISLNQRILALREKIEPLPTWHGHRVFGVDGSKINLPRELLAAGYRAPNRHQYYPQGLMSTLYHLGSGLIYDGILSVGKGRGERICLLSHLEVLQPDDILVVDRGYFSYLVLYKAIEKGIHLICRMQLGNVNSEIQDFWDSASVDKIITYNASLAAKYESKKQGFEIELKPIKLRLIKYTIDDETYLCATTLLDAEKYPLADFPSIYHGRWGIEELYKISKVFIDVEDFHGKSERTVQQECYAHMLMINIARIFESEAKNQLPPSSSDDEDGSAQDSYWQDFCGEIKRIKVNFKNCLLVLGRGIESLLLPLESVTKDCLDRIVKSIARVRQRIRPGRHTPRESKKPVKKWQTSNTRKIVYA